MFVVARLGVLLLTAAAGASALAAPRRRSVHPPSSTAAVGFGATALVVAIAGGAVALGVLGWAFLAEDWRFATVVGHARTDVPWTLRVAGIWAGPDGSLLLWSTMLAAAALVATRLASSAVPGRLLAATAAAYGLVVATEADPFERMAAPPGAGNGLQPVLEHPAMLWHPPILYLGLIAMLIPAALSVDGGPPARQRTIRLRADGSAGAMAWTLPLALALLTAGLATGANWAHVELGWGGYWAWDPIENAGLIAWLSGAALLHRLGPEPSPGEVGSPARAVAVVAVVPGIAVIWATTITRTGVLNSVHAFADRPTLRLMLLVIAVAFTVAMLALAVRVRPIGDHPLSWPPSRSQTGFAVIGLAALAVAVGTYEPAVEYLVRDQPFVTSGRFYTLLLWPLAVAGALFRVRAALRRTGPNGSTTVLAAAVGGAVVAMVVVTAATGATGLVLAAAGGALAGSALFENASTRTGGRSRLTHFGVGLLIVGVAGTTATRSETVVALNDTEAVTSIGVVTHRGVELVEGAGTDEAVATVDVTVGNRTRTFRPRLVSYPATGGQSAEVDTDRGWLADVQVVLIDAAADRATYRISHHPRISLVWAGAALTTAGLATTAAARRRGARLRPDVEPAVP